MEILNIISAVMGRGDIWPGLHLPFRAYRCKLKSTLQLESNSSYILVFLNEGCTEAIENNFWDNLVPLRLMELSRRGTQCVLTFCRSEAGFSHYCRDGWDVKWTPQRPLTLAQWSEWVTLKDWGNKMHFCFLLFILLCTLHLLFSCISLSINKCNGKRPIKEGPCKRICLAV